ncbi:MAG: Holliday junction helicase RuvA, holliday junction helicase RuvA [Parcubacteria group bacterium]|nr:Holliday junction helicase RuvA, holliday junction helicase RuvA [Parcubacteria group bacterium]
MIGAIQGTVRHKDLTLMIVDVGGVGYKVFSTTDTVLDAALNESISLWTYLAVRENALDLYGFIERDTLALFELLICISGIGPKTALGILNVATPEMLRQAVATEDTSYLTKVSGIGKRNAEKIVMELKDKLVTTAADLEHAPKGAGDVLEALLSLGYEERDARDVLKKIPKELEGTGERVKYALKLLSDQRN